MHKSTPQSLDAGYRRKIRFATFIRQHVGTITENLIFLFILHTYIWFLQLTKSRGVFLCLHSNIMKNKWEKLHKSKLVLQHNRISEMCSHIFLLVVAHYSLPAHISCYCSHPAQQIGSIIKVNMQWDEWGKTRNTTAVKNQKIFSIYYPTNALRNKTQIDIYKIIHVLAARYHIRELLQQRRASQPANIRFV
jgi:hypothetical protein